MGILHASGSILQTANPACPGSVIGRTAQLHRSDTNGFAFLATSSLLNINIMDCGTLKQEWEKLPLYYRSPCCRWPHETSICGFILCYWGSCLQRWTMSSRGSLGKVLQQSLNHLCTRITNAFLKWICNSGIESLLSPSKVSPESYYIFLCKQTFQLFHHLISCFFFCFFLTEPSPSGIFKCHLKALPFPLVIVLVHFTKLIAHCSRVQFVKTLDTKAQIVRV